MQANENIEHDHVHFLRVFKIHIPAAVAAAKNDAWWEAHRPMEAIGCPECCIAALLEIITLTTTTQHVRTAGEGILRRRYGFMNVPDFKTLLPREER